MPNKVISNQIICGDFRELCQKWPNSSVDMIFVDPPYGKDGIWSYKNIASLAKRLLKKSGCLIIYASDYWLDKTFPVLCDHLDYFYLFHSINTKGKASIFPRKIFAGAKSILVFGSSDFVSKRWVPNVLDFHKKEKSHRKDNWEQPVEDAVFFIKTYSEEGDIVFDPMCGSGTTCVAAKQLNRNYIGIDISSEQCRTAKERLISI